MFDTNWRFNRHYNQKIKPIHSSLSYQGLYPLESAADWNRPVTGFSGEISNTLDISRCSHSHPPIPVAHRWSPSGSINRPYLQGGR